jgi:lecithin-cholesterol acyltransferase
MGGFFCHYFLANVTTPEWRAKYIESAILLAPSFGGSGPAFRSLWTKELPGASFLGQFPDLLGLLGGLHIHMPNAEIFRDTVVYVEADGRTRKAGEISDLLIEHEKLPGDGPKIYERYLNFFATAPRALDVPSAIFYNSKLETVIGIDASSGIEEPISAWGDLLVNKEGPEWACSKWKSGKTVDCYDLNSDEGLVDHGTMLFHPELWEFVIYHVTDSSWQNRI